MPRVERETAARISEEIGNLMKEIETLVEEKAKESADLSKFIREGAEGQEGRWDGDLYDTCCQFMVPPHMAGGRSRWRDHSFPQAPQSWWHLSLMSPNPICATGGPLVYEGASVTMNSKALNGSQRVVVDGVISAEECQELQRLTNVSARTGGAVGMGRGC